MRLDLTTQSLLYRKIGRRRDEIRAHLFSRPRPADELLCRETTQYETIEDATGKRRWKRIRIGERWGGGRNAWFRVAFTIPRKWRGRFVSAFIDLGGDGCVFIDGTPCHGLDRFHHEVPLTQSARGGETFELVIDAVSGLPWNPDPSLPENAGSVLRRVEVAARNDEVWTYWFDLDTLYCLAGELHEDSARRARIIHLLNKSVDAFDYDHTDETSLNQSAARAAAALRPLLQCRAEASATEFACVGHSHIDVGWKWPYRETVRKCARTFSNVLQVMEYYPDHIFSQGQAQLYKFVLESYPELYKAIKHRIGEGRWEVAGGTWVEADCNIPSGESLVRQILYGKQFFREEFEIEPDTAWMPDVFGFPASLPQILSKSGYRYFATNKMHWNQFDKPPYPTFHWQGIDGSRVLAHFPPSLNYNGFPSAEWFARYECELQDKARTRQIIFTYGWGDGGGGPENRHMEYLRRSRDLEGLPECRHKSVSQFFHDIDDGTDYPEWAGELYLQCHRGTYTTQGRIKRQNRRAEILLRDAELLSVIAGASGLPYPGGELREQWEKVLVNQFHDVLPGTSIAQVYEDTDRMYEEVFETGQRVVHGAIRRIVGDGDGIAVFNTLPWDRNDLVEMALPGEGHFAVEDADGREAPSQQTQRGLLFAASAPSMGYSTYRLVNRRPKAKPGWPRVSERRLENRFLRVELDDRGQIASFVHKDTGREVMPNGLAGNLLRIFEDKPLEYPAWEIEFFHEDKYHDPIPGDDMRVVEEGPLRASVEVTRSFGKSHLRQWIIIYRDSPRIDFHTWVHWQENEKLLKVGFPVDVNADRARYEIQFGNIERATHRNTSWDFAQFEVPAQRWVDLSEHGFGVSLLNDCKYGHSIHDGWIWLSLLRSAKKPDPTADMDEHEFTYSLMPHAGSYVDAQTVRRAYELNVPLLTSMQGELRGSKSFFYVDTDNVIVETVKQAEDAQGIILRLYECHNRRTMVNVLANLPFTKVFECSLMEENQGEIRIHNGGFSFDIKPFEIRTFRLV